MDIHLTGKVALVTGASRGIGRAIAQGLLSEGVCVAAGARDLRDAPLQPSTQSQVQWLGPAYIFSARTLSSVGVR